MAWRAEQRSRLQQRASCSACKQGALLPCSACPPTLPCDPACAADKLAGLATFLTARYNFGGTLFVARVLDARGRRLRPVHVEDGGHALRLAGAALQVRAKLRTPSC